MTDPTNGPEPTAAAFDGWAVVDLDNESLVQANTRGYEVLGISVDQLPLSLADLLTATDLALVSNQVFPRVRAGHQWQGGLRLGVNRVDITPSPVLVVPHLSADSEFQPEFASLLFASAEASDAAALVMDPLTGMATRSALFRRLDRAVRRNRDSDRLLAAFFLDIDGLKNLNDRYGHEVGDTALIETAQRIAAVLPRQALAVRFGGDEFVIIDEEVVDIDQAVRFAEELLESLHAVGDYHAISASIGIAFGRTGEVDAHELIRRADTAMYRAKARGGSQVAIFDAEMRTRQRKDEALRSSLLQAISNNGFGVAAQPVFELATGRICGVELFIRVRDDSPYITSANELFRLAHEYGEAFDAAVLGRALALAKVWQRSFGSGAPRVQINVSTQSLAASKFAERVRNALTDSGVRPNAVAFEFDGRDLGAAGERERTTIQALREIGVPIIIDGVDGSILTLAEIPSWQPAMAKIGVGNHSPIVLASLVRALSTLRIASCLKGMGDPADLARAVHIGAFAGQGNALTPVRSIDRINAQLHGPQRLGF